MSEDSECDKKINDEFSISRQIILLFISIILFVLYYISAFRNYKYNQLCLAFSIVVFLWLITITYRYFVIPYIDENKNHYDGIIIEIPYEIKCMIGDSNCDKGNVNYWSLIHLSIYIIIGYLIPDCYIEIIIISIACELLESALGYTNKMIIDPITNLIGYTIGSLLYKNRQRKKVIPF